jgi:transposase
MSMKPESVPPVPEETKRVAEAAFPKGNMYMRMRDELGTFYQDDQFSPLFPNLGQPAESPWRLALICIMQFVENLSDRQTVEAVRARIDWKYVLSLELTDSGFDYSVLSEFRQRLLDNGMEQQLLDRMLSVFIDRGLLKQRGRQRTDSSHVMASIRNLNRLENVGETLRATLNSLAVAAPDWLKQVIHPDWFDRYSKRVEEYRFPESKTKRQELAQVIGMDGMELLSAVYSDDSPDWLRNIPAVEILRRTWVHQYCVMEGQLMLREVKDLPPASVRLHSPYDPEAHCGSKRSTSWIGYKVHVTETCDDDAPSIITHVETTIAPQPDVKTTESIHDALSAKGQTPEEHLMDGGYVDAGNLVSSEIDHGVEVIGPVCEDTSWQAKAGQGYAIDSFRIHWDEKTVTCPQGQTTRHWNPKQDEYGNDLIHVQFPRSVCLSCEYRSSCTRSKKHPRTVLLRPQAQYEALQEARKRQKTQQWRDQYAKRAGIEGTISQGVRSFGLRQARYIGLAKTHLQHILTAAAINIVRMDAWLTGTPIARTRTSRFLALNSVAA